jgi:putative PEP-CTERM system histidine kinase
VTALTEMDMLDTFGALGYGAASILFLALGLLLVTSWRGRLQGGLLVGAVFVNAIWAGTLATQAAWRGLSSDWIWVIETLRDVAWLLFLLRLLELQLAERSRNERRFRWARWTLYLAAAFVVVPFDEIATDLLPWREVDWALMRLAAEVLFPVAGLVLVEQVYRNTPLEHRWGIKFLCLGVGALFAFDFFFYADALLFRTLDSDLWLARGVANAFVVPLIAVSAARNPQWSFDLSVSRKIVFHTTSLVAAGIYLLIMALTGYYIRLYGGEWSSVLQIVFFFGAGLVLIVLLFSGQFRSRVKVFVNKHFFSYKYDYREEWLHLIGVLSGKALQASLAERVVYALGELVESPGGAIWLHSQGGAFEFASCWNFQDSALRTRDDFQSLSAFLSRRDWIVNLDEYMEEPEHYDGLYLPDWLEESKSLWLIVPLAHEESLLGIVLLARPRAPQQLNWESMDLLKTAARQAASYLALERAANDLADARQFEGFNRLSAFVIHDLKNLIAQLSLVAKNAERHKHNPEFLEDALVTVRNSVDRMNRLLAQLRSAMPGDRSDRIPVLDLVREAVEGRRGSGSEMIDLETSGAETAALYADRDRFGAVLGHVIQNALDAVGKEGKVLVRTVTEGQSVRIDVVDNGIGMDARFVRERLFKPFDSTKGLAGMGIGAYECREFIRSLGGRVEVFSTPGEGTRFSMILPLGEERGEGPESGPVGEAGLSAGIQ